MCSGSHVFRTNNMCICLLCAYRTKNMHFLKCVLVCTFLERKISVFVNRLFSVQHVSVVTLLERGIDIVVFSEFCQHTFYRTKNTHCVQRVWAITRFQNEEYTLCQPCCVQRVQLALAFSGPSHAFRTRNIHCVQRLSLPHF